MVKSTVEYINRGIIINIYFIYMHTKWFYNWYIKLIYRKDCYRYHTFWKRFAIKIIIIAKIRNFYKTNFPNTYKVWKQLLQSSTVQFQVKFLHSKICLRLNFSTVTASKIFQHTVIWIVRVGLGLGFRVRVISTKKMLYLLYLFHAKNENFVQVYLE